MKTFRAFKTFEPQYSKMEFHSKDTKKVIWAETDYEVLEDDPTLDLICIKYYVNKKTWIRLPIERWEIEKNGVVPQEQLTLDRVKAILNKISFLPSCVDFNWNWEVVAVTGETEYPDTEMENEGEDGWVKFGTIKGFLINTTFRRPDIITGAIGIGKGRRMWIEANATETSIVMTAWVCINLITTHELMEALTYNGAKILNPHKSLSELAYPEQLQHEFENNEQGHH